jgi:putative SOS response-associated peptidase YedK
MCNRYRVTAKQIEIAQRYGVLRQAQDGRTN